MKLLILISYHRLKRGADIIPTLYFKLYSFAVTSLKTLIEVKGSNLSSSNTKPATQLGYGCKHIFLLLLRTTESRERATISPTRNKSFPKERNFTGCLLKMNSVLHVSCISWKCRRYLRWSRGQ